MRLLFGIVTALALSVSAAAGPVNDAALAAKRPAKLLSAYGLFADGAAQLPADRVVPYDLQVPLFTDYAVKYRFAYVPDGLTATYDDTEAFVFPVGSVLVKTFAYPADLRETEKDVRLVETRLLIHQDAGWQAWAYVWNEDQTDAVLKVAGKVTPIDFIDMQGDTRSIQYIVPNKNQCKGCHSYERAVTPIGPKARSLNKDFAYAGGAENQLAYWTRAGFLAGAPDPADAPLVPAIDDASAPLDLRARAYLDVNCAHCHRLEGPGSTSGLLLTYGEANRTAWGYKKRPVAAGRGSGGLLYDIAPGDADGSIFIHRMDSTDPGVMMPEVGRTLVDEEGLALIRDWINAME